MISYYNILIRNYFFNQFFKSYTVKLKKPSKKFFLALKDIFLSNKKISKICSKHISHR